MKPIRGILYDWNGTLTNMPAERELSYGAAREIFKTYGIPPPSEERYFSLACSDFMESLYYPCGIPRTATMAEVNAIRTEYITNHLHGDWFLKESAKGVVEFSSSRVGVSCGIVSGECDSLLEKGLRESGLSNHFRYVKSSATPKSFWLKHALKSLKLSADETVYIDDSAEGMHAHRELGIITIGLGDGYAKMDVLALEGACMIVPTLDLVPEYLSKILHM